MDYRIEKKEAFTVIGNRKVFSYDGAKEKIGQFWLDHYQTGKGKTVRGSYGINIAENTGKDAFEYLIADLCTEEQEVPEGFVTRTIPELTWVIFPCVGALPEALQEVNTKIFSEWLPVFEEYEFLEGYCVEWYDDTEKYPKGEQDETYYSEIWIPVKKK